MAIIHILKKTGKEIPLEVQENADEIYNKIIGEDYNNDRQGNYIPPKKFIDSILLTFVDGKKMGINPRYIAYYND